VKNCLYETIVSTWHDHKSWGVKEILASYEIFTQGKRSVCLVSQWIYQNHDRDSGISTTVVILVGTEGGRRLCGHMPAQPFENFFGLNVVLVP
jgi:hypothetical protein